MSTQMVTFVMLFVASTLITVTGAVIAMTIHQRRYLRTRASLGGRLLLAQDEERRRLANELHADVLQRLHVASSRLVNATPGDAQAVKAQLEAVATDLRNLARGLHPGVIDHLPICLALQSLTESMRPLLGGVDFKCSDVPELPPRLKLNVYRIVQDALRNVALHAPGAVAQVTLTCCDGTLQLSIRDTGRGFDVRAATRGAGLGLRAMRERCEYLDGRFEIRSSPGNCTCITATFPVTGMLNGLAEGRR